MRLAGDLASYAARLRHGKDADSGAIDRFRRITEAYEYLSAHLKDNAHGNGHTKPGPTAPPRADAGMPDGYAEAASAC